MGLFEPATGQRALLQGRENGERSYLAGRLALNSGRLTFEPINAPPPASGDTALFTRAENGWAAGLHPMDRFIKNTCEVLCPLNELTAQMQMTGHEFLTADRKAQRTTFGEGEEAVQVVVNLDTNSFSFVSKTGGKVVLPQYGFVVEGPTFVAFHAANWSGLEYSVPTLFTLRSMEGRPIERSRQVRVFHGFGDEKIRVAGNTQTVARELVWRAAPNGISK
jgi:hypothetical protein